MRSEVDGGKDLCQALDRCEEEDVKLTPTALDILTRIASETSLR